MPTAMDGRSFWHFGTPSRQRMSMTVTMRPRRLRMPAISGADSGTGVRRFGMNTSCTREMGRPNNWPPIVAVTYSVKLPLPISLFAVIPCFLCRFVHIGGLLLERRDKTLAVELRHIVVEPG